ncbi:hypothetical protein SAMN00017477_2214 [Peptoniphilus asaccharolyticus DSM 20463]|uniref:Uncharacterized protein n=1 Tax=Peptoniphilus asaccharolyticus DSM 20463 TaxID=573058 RepID=A0A1W1VM88_PEPAS|nr:hypothetical protein SAMN00017477_2214 [Peptoniphilus asaccharolyticus DSM 20463]
MDKEIQNFVEKLGYKTVQYLGNIKELRYII